MRFYTQKFPEVDDLVMVQVKQIAGQSLSSLSLGLAAGFGCGRLTSLLALTGVQRWVPTSSSFVLPAFFLFIQTYS